MASPTDPTAAVLDASAAVAYCASEAGRDVVVRQYLADCGSARRPVSAPGAIVSECLYVFCKKRERGELDPAGHTAAVAALDALMTTLDPPIGGEGRLVLPAARLVAGYACPKTTDSIYLALAEQLAARGEVVKVVTFDDGQAKRADRLPGVTGRCLTT